MTSDATVASEAPPVDKIVSIFQHGLPVELMRFVVEMAAMDIIPPCNIALTCKLFRKWVDPILYRAVQLHTKNAGASFRAFLESRTQSDPAFISNCIKSIAIAGGAYSVGIPYILKTCTGISRLELWTTKEHEEDPAPIPLDSFDATHLEKLTHFSCSLFPNSSVETFPLTISHLFIFYDANSEDFDWEGLFKRCTKLTHITVRFPAMAREELDFFAADDEVPRLGIHIHERHAAVVPDRKLHLVIVPQALVSLAIIPVALGWKTIVHRKFDPDNLQALPTPRFLVIYPRKIAEELKGELLYAMVCAKMREEDISALRYEMDLMLRKEVSGIGYLMANLQGIERRIWDYVEQAFAELRKQDQERQ